MIHRINGGYNIQGYGKNDGCLWCLTQDELQSLQTEIACQLINIEYERTGGQCAR